MDEFDVPSWDMDKKTEALVDNIFSNMAILSAKKDNLSGQSTGNDAVRTKKRKRKGKGTKVVAKLNNLENNLEQITGNENIKTKSEKQKKKKRKAAVKPNDSVANLSSGAGEPGEGLTQESEVSRKKKRKKKSAGKKNKYAHLGRKGMCDDLRTLDPSPTNSLKTCIEPATSALTDKNIGMINENNGGKNEKQIIPEKSNVSNVDKSVQCIGKKRKFCEIASEEERLPKANFRYKDKDGGKVKKRKISVQDDEFSKHPKSGLVKHSGLKKKQKISVGGGEVQNTAELEMSLAGKQQASKAIQKSVKIGSVKGAHTSENKQKKKLKKKNGEDLCSNTVCKKESLSEEFTSRDKTCQRKLPFSISKLRVALAEAKMPSKPAVVVKAERSVKKAVGNSEAVKGKDKMEKAEPSLRESMMARLTAARFRLINEELYTSTSKDAVELFKSDKESFKVYHEGYQSQVAKWPTVPVDKMLQYIKSRSSGLVIADFGCGDARIAQSVPNKVHSFDLVALNKHVTVCDMKRVPLGKASVDIAVFCLSLMGTNLVEFLCEANRVLKSGGILLIAEVVSRFNRISVFVKKLQKLGFTLVERDQSNTMFVWFEFKKTGQPSNAAKLPSIELDPCTYKKR